MKLAAGVIAILVVPVAVYATDSAHRTPLFPAALGVYLTLGVGLLVFSLTLRPSKRPDRSMDERALDRRLTVAALLAAVVIANFTLLEARAATAFISAFAIAWSLVWLVPATRRISVTTRMLINRDVRTVFGFKVDMRNEPQYIPEALSVEKITDGDIGVGTRFRSIVRMDANTTFEGIEEIVAIEWNRSFESRVANGTRPNTGVTTFEAVGPSTEMSYRFQVENSYASALLGLGLLRWTTIGQIRRRRLESWARLKQLLESRPDT